MKTPFLRFDVAYHPGNGALVKARLVLHFIKSLGFKGRLEYHETELPNFAVYVGCSPEQETEIFRHPGMPLNEAYKFCRDRGVDFLRLFYWLPEGINRNWRFNPCVKPVNSADGREHCEANNYYLTVS
jgi:hypothetical protein